jgi:predicted O-linked N-acetylglucosamine transferase (SPINDLY family)
MSFLFNRAVEAHRSGRVSEAEALYREIIASDPRNFDALHLLGIVCSETGKVSDADKFFRQALAIDPNFPPCFVNYGFYLLKQSRFSQALECFDKALALFPNFAQAWLGRGNVMRELGRNDEAFAAYSNAISLDPNMAEAHAGCGNMLAALRRYDEAIKSYDKALAIAPGIEFVESQRLHCKMRLCDWTNFRFELHRLREGGKTRKLDAHPFEFLSMSSSEQEQLDTAKAWVARKYPRADTPVWRGETYKHDRIRVAYVSSDFREHAVSYLAAGMFECHDKSRFEVTAVSIGVNDGSDMRRRLENSFEHFIDASKLGDDEIASRIAKAQVDILVDMNGFTHGCRTGIFARRPSPVQVNYLGYPGTMGANYIDYLIADRVLVSPAHQAFYAEKLVYMPDCYQANDAKRAISQKNMTRAEVGLPKAATVFCCFNNNHKIMPDVFDSWMRILGRVDNSVLWLFEDNASVVVNLKKEAAARGIDPVRIIFAQRMAPPEHLARHRLADLFLDTLPYNAHTTASDSLWAGVPVVTRIGETFAGRVAASILNAVGLPELVVETRQAYEELAIELASNREKLSGLRKKLADNLSATPLFDTRRYTQSIELAYVEMHRRSQGGLAPETIDLHTSILSGASPA